MILEYGSSVAEALSLFDHSTTNTGSLYFKPHPLQFIHVTFTLLFELCVVYDVDATEGGRRNSVHTTVYSLLNQTSTTMGSRRLKDWLLRPLTHIVLIQNRYRDS